MGTAKTDINQFISGKPIHFGCKSQSMVIVQNLSFNYNNQEPNEKGRTGFEFSLHTSEEK